MPRKFWTVWTDGVHRMNVIRIGETVPWATATLTPVGQWMHPKTGRRGVAYWRLIVMVGERQLYRNIFDTWQAGRAKARQVLEQHRKEV